jgi:hypothetical protein
MAGGSVQRLKVDWLVSMLYYGDLSLPLQYACVEGPQSQDEQYDVYDIHSWAWSLYNPPRILDGLCNLPVGPPSGIETTEEFIPKLSAPVAPVVPLVLDNLLILGLQNSSEYLDNSNYTFDHSGATTNSIALPSDTCNVRVVRSPDGAVHMVNSATGVSRLSDGYSIAPLGLYPFEGGTVRLGTTSTATETYGRSLLDVAVDSDNAVYVAPAVIDGSDVGGARLVGDTITAVYPSSATGEVREIEVTDSSVYLTTSRAVLAFDKMTGTEYSSLAIDSPAGLCATDRLYVGSNGDVYGLSFSDLSVEMLIDLPEIEHITGVTEDELSDELLISGFDLGPIPAWLTSSNMPFNNAKLAKYSKIDHQVTMVAVDPNVCDLMVPLSVLWTGSCDEADLNGDGKVNNADLPYVDSSAKLNRLIHCWLN